jgi:pimeloyl-ACP methyl ester carboxylesterase
MSHSRAEVAPDGSGPRVLRLPDGRDLAYCLYGRADGTPVLFFYGTPGTMFLPPDRLIPVEELGIYLLVVDRPGYGASTRRPGRRVVAAAEDLAVLTGHLDWDHFAVWGLRAAARTPWPVPRAWATGSRAAPAW